MLCRVLATPVGLMILVLASSCSSNSASSGNVTTKVVEATYPDLLQQMKTLAEQGGSVSSSDLETYKKVVSPEEILEAKVGSNHAYMIMGEKSLDWKEQSSFFQKSPQVGQPVVNRYLITFADGRQLTIASYEARIIDKNGKEQELVISFDLAALEERLRNEKRQEEVAASKEP